MTQKQALEILSATVKADPFTANASGLAGFVATAYYFRGVAALVTAGRCPAERARKLAASFCRRKLGASYPIDSEIVAEALAAPMGAPLTVARGMLTDYRALCGSAR